MRESGAPEILLNAKNCVEAQRNLAIPFGAESTMATVAEADIPHSNLLQGLMASTYGGGGLSEEQRRLYSTLLGLAKVEQQIQQAQRFQMSHDHLYDYSLLLDGAAGGSSAGDKTAIGVGANLPRNNNCFTSFLSPSSSSTSSMSSSGHGSPTSMQFLMGGLNSASLTPATTPFASSAKYLHFSKDSQQKERKRRRMIGNLDNTLDGLVAKRTDSDPKQKRYRTEKEAIELPDDETEMKRMAMDPDVSTRMCSVCGYQGKWVSEMIRHKRVHTSDRPFRCKYCNRTSKWKADLIRHVAKTHGIRVVSKYSRSKAFEGTPQKNVENILGSKDMTFKQVDYDEAIFDDVNNNDNTTESDEKRPDTKVSQAVFRCSTCFLEQPSVSDLVDHLHSAHNVSPFECLKCKRSFDELHAAKSHFIHPHPQQQEGEELSEAEQSNAQCSPLSIKVNFCHVYDQHHPYSTSSSSTRSFTSAEASELSFMSIGCNDNEIENEHNDNNNDDNTIDSCCLSSAKIATVTNECSNHSVANSRPVAAQMTEKVTEICVVIDDVEAQPSTNAVDGEQQQQLLRCDKCPFESYSSAAINSHCLGHQIIKRKHSFQCAFCIWCADKMSVVEEHMFLHTPDPQQFRAAIIEHFGEEEESTHISPITATDLTQCTTETAKTTAFSPIKANLLNNSQQQLADAATISLPQQHFLEQQEKAKREQLAAMLSLIYGTQAVAAAAPATFERAQPNSQLQLQQQIQNLKFASIAETNTMPITPICDIAANPGVELLQRMSASNPLLAFGFYSQIFEAISNQRQN